MKILTLAATLAMMTVPALAAEHVMEMKNTGDDGTRMAFEPALVRASVGDTIVFRPVDNGHAAASVVVPAGVEAFEGQLNAETRITLTTPGVYLVKSKPHFALGMIGMVVVDSPAPNRSEIDAFKPRGSLMRTRFEALKGQL